ncbi:MAG: ABC transporter ATP-binding protein [Thermaerobacter sp.]|nr:ABC transporter ATP-binding protein [Thermaerobacter sp.]
MTPNLDIAHLSLSYLTERGRVPALRNVSLAVYPNEIVGLVGESGSGKSTLAMAAMRLLRPQDIALEGSVRVQGQEVYRLSPEDLKRWRWEHLAMVFQSSMNALNPVLSVASHFFDTLSAHRAADSKPVMMQRVRQLLQLVRLDPDVAVRYPHELSGGMRQRVVIALALALNPKVLIMDEPTTALDVVVQKSILDEISAIQTKHQLSVLFITHDFTLVQGLAHRIAVMYAGEIVQITERESLARESVPNHPYTTALMRGIPRLTGSRATLEGIPGEPPDMTRLPRGCAFYPRCQDRRPVCESTPLPEASHDTYVRCHALTAERREERC